MKARVTIMLKDGVLDPQGEAIRHALGGLGHQDVTGVRQGKLIELDLAATDAVDGVVADVGRGIDPRRAVGPRHDRVLSRAGSPTQTWA